mmetsp:Transcript_17378/g.51931  ORF Transcript_17378/g.51931 Transcript_17378/m.51931 type:complete len:580 (+) Transcript_17378:28-1767(+)
MKPLLPLMLLLLVALGQCLSNSPVCDLCQHEVKSALGPVLLGNATLELLTDAAVALCDALHLRLVDHTVCEGIVREFRGEFVGVLSRTYLSPQSLCAYASLCSTPWTPPPRNWTVPVPGNKPPLPPPSVPSSSWARMLFAHFTDLHYDPEYRAGLSAECGQPLCCRPPAAVATEPSEAAGYWGDPRCDTPLRTVESALEDAFSRNLSFVLWTGDSPPHNIWNQSRQDQINTVQQSAALLRSNLPGVRVFPCLGNHESAPVNSFPPSSLGGSPSSASSNQWLLDAIADAWASWLPTSAQETLRRGGFYTAHVQDNLHVVALNLNYGMYGNWWLLINDTDPADQLHWLAETLLDLETRGQQVLLIGHQPPNDPNPAFSWALYDLVNRFESTIVAQFYGHTHTDSFRIFFDSVTPTIDGSLPRATNVAYVSPSITPYTLMNPGYRVFELATNHSTSLLTESFTYVLDLELANRAGTPQPPAWQLEYAAMSAYSLPDLSPASWANLTERMRNDDQLFQQFYSYYRKSFAGASACVGSCQRSMICELREARSNDTTFCVSDTSADLTTTYEDLLAFRALHETSC